MNNHHLPRLKLQDVLDTSLVHSHNSSAFFYPRGFPEPSPRSFQQPTNTPTPQARALGPRAQLHPRLSQRSGLSATPVHCLSVPALSQSVTPLPLPRSSAFLTWTSATPTGVPCRCPLGTRQAAVTPFGGTPSPHNLLRPPSPGWITAPPPPSWESPLSLFARESPHLRHTPPGWLGSG